MVIYEIINKVNGKRYIGKDKYNNPNYLGSGKILNKAIKKYGTNNFIKTILEQCNDEDHLNERERHWIKITNAQSSDVYYNIGPGGEGGDNITHNPNRDAFIEKMKVINNLPRANTKHSNETKQNQSKAATGRYSIEWFVKTYGPDLGPDKYFERNKMLSNRELKGSNNPAWREVLKEELENLIQKGSSQKELMSAFDISEVCLRNKLELYWNTRSLKEVRNKLII